MESTIVSYLPYELCDPKPGLIPPYIIIPAAPERDFVVVAIPDCINHVYLDEDRGSLTRVIPGEQVAGAIAYDHINASYGTSDVGFPGIKAIPGRHTKEELLKMFSVELKGLENAQRNWFQNLVRLADDIWSDPTARGKTRSITETQRHAAKFLGLNKEWVTDAPKDNNQCPACRTFIPVDALICANCKTIVKPVEYKKFVDEGNLPVVPTKVEEKLVGAK